MFKTIASILNPMKAATDDIREARKTMNHILWVLLVVDKVEWPDESARIKAIQSFDREKHELEIKKLPDGSVKITKVDAKP